MYIAKRPCRFNGQDYIVGEFIPDDVITPEAARKLIQQNRIVEIEEPKQEIIKVTPDTTEGKDVTPPQTPLNDDNGTKAPEGDQTPGEGTKEPKEPEKMTRNKLEKMRKEDVIEYAKEKIGLPVDESMTKEEIIKAVMLAGE